MNEIIVFQLSCFLGLHEYCSHGRAAFLSVSSNFESCGDSNNLLPEGQELKNRAEGVPKSYTHK
jgi:hypothetical protein